MRSQRAGLIKPIASRTSSRPAVNDRAEQAGHMTAPLPERSPSKKPLAIGAVPHMPQALSFKSSRHDGLIVQGVIARLRLGWRDVSDRLQQPAVIDTIGP